MPSSNVVTDDDERYKVNIKGDLFINGKNFNEILNDKIEEKLKVAYIEMLDHFEKLKKKNKRKQ